MGETLTESDLAFLDAIRDGSSFRTAADRLHYTTHWAKKRSRQIRGRLGVATIEEALRMTDDTGVSRAEFDGLRKLIESTNEAVADLAKAVTPQQQQDAQQRVVEREVDEKTMAKRLGISLDDVARVREENEYAAFRKRQERLDKEREDEAAAAAGNEPARDGLGGILNLARGGKDAS